MSRVGAFTRARSSGANLTSLISSLYKQQQAETDKAMFDAWQNGGTFDGKPVTDGRILAYIQSRRDGFSKDDPLYSEWNNSLIQHKFSIGESKIGLAFKQGKVGAGAVASFYNQQLKSIPQDSQFYRDVAGRATQWANAAVGRARSAGRSRASAATDARLTSATNTGYLYTAVEGAINDLAKRAYAARDWHDVPAGDLINLVNNAGLKLPDGRTLTYGVWQQLAQQRYQAFTTEINVKDQLGKGTITLRTQRQAFLTNTVGQVNALDDRAHYEEQHQLYVADLAAAHNDPYAVARITQNYVDALRSINTKAAAATGSQANSSDFIGALNNEITAITTGQVNGPSAWDLFDNRTAGTPYANTSDIQSTADSLYGIQDPNKAKSPTDLMSLGTKIAGLQKGAAIMSGQPVPPNVADAPTLYYGQQSAGQQGFGVYMVPTSDPKNPLGGGGLAPNQQVTYSDVNGQALPVVLAGQEVKGAAISYVGGAQNGQPVDVQAVYGNNQQQLQADLRAGKIKVDTGNETAVGYVYANPVTGQQTYGIVDPATGKQTFTTDNPWATATNIGGVLVLGHDANNNPTVFGQSPIAPIGGQGQAPQGAIGSTGIILDPSLSDAQRMALGQQYRDVGVQNNDLNALSIAADIQGAANYQRQLQHVGEGIPGLNEVAINKDTMQQANIQGRISDINYFDKQAATPLGQPPTQNSGTYNTGNTAFTPSVPSGVYNTPPSLGLPALKVPTNITTPPAAPGQPPSEAQRVNSLPFVQTNPDRAASTFYAEAGAGTTSQNPGDNTGSGGTSTKGGAATRA